MAVSKSSSTGPETSTKPAMQRRSSLERLVLICTRTSHAALLGLRLEAAHSAALAAARHLLRHVRPLFVHLIMALLLSQLAFCLCHLRLAHSFLAACIFLLAVIAGTSFTVFAKTRTVTHASRRKHR